MEHYFQAGVGNEPAMKADNAHANQSTPVLSKMVLMQILEKVVCQPAAIVLAHTFQVASEPCFDRLRTKEQLGYGVGSTVSHTLRPLQLV